MTEERITETRDENGNTHTTRTVVQDSGSNGSGAGKIVGLLVLVGLAIGAFILYRQVSDSEIAANEAITEAASEVSETAGEVGEAAQNASEAVQDAVDQQ